MSFSPVKAPFLSKLKKVTINLPIIKVIAWNMGFDERWIALGL